LAVKFVVWVMKPGPIALVAIRKMAPISAVRRERRAGRGSSTVATAGAEGSVDMGTLLDQVVSEWKWCLSMDPRGDG
jgi:hypothetical protein